MINGNVCWKQPESEHRILHTSDRGWVMAEGHKPMYHLHRPATSEPTGPGDLHKFDWTSQQKGAQFDNPSVTLRRPEDDEDLSSAMRALWHDPELCDVRFELDDGSMVNASRTILAARSPYFKTMFFGSMREAREATAGEPIKLREIRRETLDGVLEFCYTGSISSFIDSLTRSDEAVAYAKYAQKVDDPAEEWFDHESKMVESLTELLKAANLFQLERLLKMWKSSWRSACASRASRISSRWPTSTTRTSCATPASPSSRSTPGTSRQDGWRPFPRAFWSRSSGRLLAASTATGPSCSKFKNEPTSSSAAPPS